MSPGARHNPDKRPGKPIARSPGDPGLLLEGPLGLGLGMGPLMMRGAAA